MKENIAKLLILIELCACKIYAEDSKPNEVSTITNGLQMSISLTDEKGQIKMGQPCILLIRYKNLSTNETFWVYERNGIEHDPDYSFTVISPSGKNISPDMKHIHHGDSGGNNPVNPSQSIEINFDLSAVCKLEEIGTYKVIAEKKEIFLLEKRKLITVVSNPLNVSVVSGDK